jgi:hypothetical protein
VNRQSRQADFDDSVEFSGKDPGIAGRLVHHRRWIAVYYFSVHRRETLFFGENSATNRE